MTISDVYKDYIKEGKSQKESAKICLSILTSGLIDASDDETYNRLINEFISSIWFLFFRK